MFRLHDTIYTRRYNAGHGSATTFYLAPDLLNKWMHQNKAERIDFVDGCLLDNLLVSTPRGYAAIYEHFVNAWESNYIVEFQTGAATDIIDKWAAVWAARLADSVEKEV